MTSSTARAADNHGTLVVKIKHALDTYESASKKYLSAIKDLETSMEGIAIAFRELAQGERTDVARQLSDRFCTALDTHKNAKGNEKSQSNPSSSSVVPPEQYYFSTYMSELSSQMTAAMAELKADLKKTDSSREKRDKSIKSYQKYHKKVDEKESKLAKKNRGVAEDPSYAKLIKERDVKKAESEADEKAFEDAYEKLLQKRTATLIKVLNALGSSSSKYYTGIASIMYQGVPTK